MTETQSPTAVISNARVRLHKEYYGKGPTKAKTYILDDVILCVLKGGLTTVERTLIESGHEGAVRGIRLAFQQAMRKRSTGTVEEATGRKVIAYMRQVHMDPDVSSELFIVESENVEEDLLEPVEEQV